MRAGAHEGPSLAEVFLVWVLFAAVAAAIATTYARLPPEPDHPDIRAVHLGEHHGLDGVLLALAALALTRELARMRRPRLRLALAGWLSLMLVYGLANALEDFWLEQVWKRGTTSFRFPAMQRPDLAPEWIGIVLASAAVYALLTRPTLRLGPRRP